MPRSTPLSCSHRRPWGGMTANTVRGSIRQRIPKRPCCFRDITSRRLRDHSPGMERSSLPRPMAPIRSGDSRTITMEALSGSMVVPLRRFQMTGAGRCFPATGTARWAHRGATLALEPASIHSSLIWFLRNRARPRDDDPTSEITADGGRSIFLAIFLPEFAQKNSPHLEAFVVKVPSEVLFGQAPVPPPTSSPTSPARGKTKPR